MRWIVLTLVALVSLLTSCTHTPPAIGSGVQQEYVSFVPARIAVVGCRMWPSGAAYAGRPLTNADQVAIDGLCAKFDQFVLEGFSDQPYMRGLSPRVVAQLISRAEKPVDLASIPELWHHRADDCRTCNSPAAFYVNSIAHRPEWEAWLGDLSRAARHADALLVPFLTYAYAVTRDDRGILSAEKHAGIALLLIDTNNGSLIWAGGREATAANKRLAAANVDDPPPPPGWEELHERLFTEDVFREFPGRQNYK